MYPGPDNEVILVTETEANAMGIKTLSDDKKPEEVDPIEVPATGTTTTSSGEPVNASAF